MRRIYLWERDGWPVFTWDAGQLLVPIGNARREQGGFAQQVAGLGFADRLEAELQAMAQEVTDTSKIEGEHLDYASVRSSVARRLGVDHAAILPDDVRAAGVVDMMLDATKRSGQPLTEARLLHWHTGLFPIVDGRQPDVAVGQWRTDVEGPMRVLSGRVDSPNVHFEAPPADRVPREIAQLLEWFNTPNTVDGLVRSAIAHLWFVTVHPFEDGNGRVARAIADMALAQDDHFSQRFFSMSRQILLERKAYYDVLERTQRGDVDVTEWLLWYLDCYVRAVRGARAVLADALRASRFWTVHADVPFSDRQRKVLNRFLHQFEGNLTARKWAGIAHTSQDTAARDLNDLVTKGVLFRNPGGSKNTSYSLTLHTLEAGSVMTDNDTKQRVSMAANHIAVLLQQLLTGANCNAVTTSIEMPDTDPGVVQAKVTGRAQKDEADIELATAIWIQVPGGTLLQGDTINIIASSREDSTIQGAYLTSMGKFPAVAHGGVPEYQLEQNVFNAALEIAIQKMKEAKRNR